MSDEYALVSRGKLKLKSDKKDKKSKKSKKDGVKDGRIDKNKPNGTTEEQYSSEYTRPSDNNKPKLTKAELSYKKMREKMVWQLLFLFIRQMHLEVRFFFLQQLLKYPRIAHSVR